MPINRPGTLFSTYIRGMVSWIAATAGSDPVLIFILAIAFGAARPAAQQAPGQADAANISQINGVTLAIGGKVQVQKEGEHVWKKADSKFIVTSGDLIKTGYKSFMILRLDRKSQIVLGSNAKMLMELLPNPPGSPFPYTSKFTVFEGACFFYWQNESDLRVFTSNAQAAAIQGKFTVSFSNVSSLSTFFSLKDRVFVQSIITKQAVEIPPGEFSSVQVDQNPSEPVYINSDIANNLRSYFGEKFIDKEMEKAKINIEGSQQEATAETKDETKQAVVEEETRLVPAFDVLASLKKIREIEAGKNSGFMASYWFDEMAAHRYYTEVQGRLVSGSKDTSGSGFSYPGVRVRAGMRYGKLAFALNFPIEKNDSGYSMALEGISGILDKIYYIAYYDSLKSTEFKLGPIRNLTFNRGLLVSNFSNEMKSQVAQPLGLSFTWTPWITASVSGFIADLSSPSLMGVNLLYDDGWTAFGASYVSDSKQGEALTPGDAVFRSDTVPVVRIKSKTSGISAWDLFVETQLTQDEGFNFFGYVGAAFLQSGGFIGSVYQFPGFNIIFRRYSFFLEGVLSVDKMHNGYINEFYLEDRTSFIKGGPDSSLRSLSLTDRHPPMRFTKGFRSGLDWQVAGQLWVGATYGQNFGFLYTNQKDWRIADSIWAEENMTSRELTLRIFGGRNLISGLQRFELFYSLLNGGLMRQVRSEPSARSEHPYIEPVSSKGAFESLNATLGALVEYSILSNTSIIAQYRGYPFDHNGSGIFDKKELLTELSATLRLKF